MNILRGLSVLWIAQFIGLNYYFASNGSERNLELFERYAMLDKPWAIIAWIIWGAWMIYPIVSQAAAETYESSGKTVC